MPIAIIFQNGHLLIGRSISGNPYFAREGKGVRGSPSSARPRVVHVLSSHSSLARVSPQKHLPPKFAPELSVEKPPDHLPWVAG